MSKSASREWELLLRLSLESSLQRISASCKRRRRQGDTVASRVSRAIELANSGKLSNARPTLEGDAVAPSNEKTWKLSDENRRPRSVRELLNRRIVSQDPPMPVDVDGDLLAKNLRTARRVVGRPSGATTEHLKLLLESQVCGIVC